MNISVLKPNVVKFRIRTDRSDALHTRCLWADILIDFDNYSISAQTDCGDYSYRWAITKDESFLDLCLRMMKDEEYLLSKFSERSVFSLSETKQLYFECNCLDRSNPDDLAIICAVEEIDAFTESGWIQQMRDLDEAPWDYIVREYPAQAHTFVCLLQSVVLPKLKEDKRIGA